MILSYKFFTDLPEDIFIYLSSLTGANKIFLRQICKYWCEVLPCNFVHHWLDIILKEPSINLLKEAINQGCHIYADFFEKALKVGNIELLDYLNSLEISHDFTAEYLSNLNSTKWLKNNGYYTYIEWEVYVPVIPLDVAEYLYSTHDIDIIPLNCAILTTNDAERMKEIDNFEYSHVYSEHALYYGSIIAVNFIHSIMKEMFENKAKIYPLSSSNKDFLEKIEFLLSIGIKPILREHIENIKIIEILEDKGYNLELHSRKTTDIETLKWRLSRGFSICSISMDNVETLKFCLENISPKICPKNNISLYNYDTSKIFIDYACQHEFLNDCSFHEQTTLSIKYLLQKGYTIEKLLPSIVYTGNIKLIREYIDKIHVNHFTSHVISSGNAKVLDFLLKHGLNVTTLLLENAILDSNPASIRWLHKHGAIITEDEVDNLSILSPNCCKVIEELCGIFSEVG